MPDAEKATYLNKSKLSSIGSIRDLKSMYAQKKQKHIKINLNTPNKDTSLHNDDDEDDEIDEDRANDLINSLQRLDTAKDKPPKETPPEDTSPRLKNLKQLKGYKTYLTKQKFSHPPSFKTPRILTKPSPRQETIHP